MRFWFVIEGGERDLRGVEELVGALFGNRIDEDAVSRAGDEVADVLVAGKRGHGFTVGRPRIEGSERLFGAGGVRIFQAFLVDALPGGHAALDGGLGCFGVGLGRLRWGWWPSAQLGTGFREGG